MDEAPEDVPPLIPPGPVPASGGPAVSPPAAGPWGLWATIGWFVLIAAGYLLVQAIVLIVYAGREVFRPDLIESTLEEVSNDGLLLAFCTIASAPVGVGLCVFFAWLRRGIRVRDYLDWRRPRGREVLGWCGALIAFGVVTDLVTTQLLKRQLVPEVMVEIYRNAGVLPLLWLAIVVAAPVVEEFMFRGFLLAGLRGSRHSHWRDLASVVATAALWAVIHLQYDAYESSIIFLGGILLGYARVLTGSLPLCILLHSLMNLVATVEVALMLA